MDKLDKKDFDLTRDIVLVDILPYVAEAFTGSAHVKFKDGKIYINFLNGDVFTLTATKKCTDNCS